MIANIADKRLQVITAKNIAAVNVLIPQCMAKRQPDGKMGNRLRGIGQGLEHNSNTGGKAYLKEMGTLVKSAEKGKSCTPIILLSGQKTKVKDLTLAMGLHCVLIVMGRNTVKTLQTEIKNSAQSVVKKLKESQRIATYAQQRNNGKNRE
jgi:hypothetical protein